MQRSFQPLRFADSVETIDPSEADTAAKLREELRSIMLTTQKDYRHGVRSVHAKSHALLEGVLRVKDGLPPQYQQGLFASPRDYPVVIRYSTIPGDLLSDAVSVPRGFAMKVIDVQGPRLAGSEADATQDFVFANGPAFSAPNPAKFLSSLSLLAKTTDKAEWAKKALSSVLRRVERGVEAVGGNSPLLNTLGGYPLTNPASDTFYSQTAFRYGDYIAKFSIAPASQNLKALEGKEFALDGRDDAWRDEMTKLFANEGAAWELRVQLRTDAEKMPIEDASVVWPEDLSPYMAVATIEVTPQRAWSKERASIGDDQLAFSPWHGLAAHRPLGAVNRVRKDAYKMSAEIRGAYNKCPIHEPREKVALPE